MRDFRRPNIYLWTSVAPEFLKSIPKEQARKELSLENTLTVLLMGGSLGIGDIENTFKSFAKCKRDIQIIAVAGKNTALKKRLDSLAASFPMPVKIFGYTDSIPCSWTHQTLLSPNREQ